MTYIDLVGLFSTFLIGLGIAGVLMERIYGEAKSDRRHQARRVRW